MRMINKLLFHLRQPREFSQVLLNYLSPLIKNDATYIKMRWKLYMDYPLRLKNPQTFNEKMQWLKLYDRRPEYTMMVDKYEVKEHVASIIGEEYIIPTLFVYESVDDIEFNALPDQFVLKCTHDSGGLVICKNKEKLDINHTKQVLNKCLNRNYYYPSREWPYKNVKPRIIAEKYMEESPNSNEGLVDYKFMCFNGIVKCCFTCTDRHSTSGLKVTFYDDDWNIMPFDRSHPRETSPIQKPISYEQMKTAAEKLSAALPFARIDFYEINKRPYFGEVTLYPGGGLEAFQPEEWDYKLGSWLELPEKITH